MSVCHYMYPSNLVDEKSNCMKNQFLNTLLLSASLFYYIPSSSQNYVLSFDGVNDCVTLPYSVQPSGSNFTAEAWVYLDPTGGVDQKILMNLTWSGGAKGYGLTIYKNETGYYFCPSIYMNSSGYFTPNSAPIPTGTWTHVAMTWKKNDSIISYLNGHYAGATSTSTYSYVSSGVSTYMGAGSAASWAPLKGKIEDVRIWNTTRTATEIHDNLFTSFNGNETGLMAYYKMSNGSGTSLSDNKTGGSYNGTLTNGTTWEVHSIMPLRFVSFTGQIIGSDHLLNWTTAAERDNSYFDIQRSTDGQEFKVIGTINSKGNAIGEQQYSFRDISPLEGTNYYRLRQVDQDGNYQYSEIVSLISKKAIPNIIGYTNPVVNGQLALKLQKPVLVSILQAGGAIIYSQVLNAGQQQIDVSRFNKGFYWIKAEEETLMIVIE